MFLFCYFYDDVDDDDDDLPNVLTLKKKNCASGLGRGGVFGYSWVKYHFKCFEFWRWTFQKQPTWLCGSSAQQKEVFTHTLTEGTNIQTNIFLFLCSELKLQQKLLSFSSGEKVISLTNCNLNKCNLLISFQEYVISLNLSHFCLMKSRPLVPNPGLHTPEEASGISGGLQSSEVYIC